MYGHVFVTRRVCCDVGLTVIDVISNAAFQGSSVVGGWTGLQRPVTGVTVAEVPDSAQWLEGGELVLSTAYIVRNDPDAFVQWLRTLVEHGASGMAVKPQRFLGTLPQEIGNEADRLGCPLISLPYTVNWPSLIRPVTADILLDGQGLYPDAHLNKLTDLLQQRAGFPSTCQAMATLFDCGVVLSDMQGHILGLGVSPGQAADLKPAVEMFVNDPGALLGWRNNLQVLQSDARWVEQREDGYWVRAYPLRAAEGFHGALSVVAGSPEALRRKEAELGLWAGALAAVYKRLESRHETPDAFQNAALQTLLREEGASVPASNRTLARALFTPGFVAVVSLARADKLSSVSLRTVPGSGELDITDELLLPIEQWVGQRDPLAAATVIDGQPVVVAHAEDPQAWAEGLHRHLTELSSTKQVMVAVGGMARDIAGYRRSLKQAQGTMRLARSWRLYDQVLTYEGLGIERVLVNMEDLSGVGEFARELLEPLLKAEQSDELIATLKAYFAADGEIGRMADKLFLHPNTIRYRLRRIESLLDVNMRSIEQQAQLLIALKMKFPDPD